MGHSLAAILVRDTIYLHHFSPKIGHFYSTFNKDAGLTKEEDGEVGEGKGEEVVVHGGVEHLGGGGGDEDKEWEEEWEEKKENGED